MPTFPAGKRQFKWQSERLCRSADRTRRNVHTLFRNKNKNCTKCETSRCHTQRFAYLPARASLSGAIQKIGTTILHNESLQQGRFSYRKQDEKKFQHNASPPGQTRWRWSQTKTQNTRIQTLKYRWNPLRSANRNTAPRRYPQSGPPIRKVENQRDVRAKGAFTIDCREELQTNANVLGRRFVPNDKQGNPNTSVQDKIFFKEIQTANAICSSTKEQT